MIGAIMAPVLMLIFVIIFAISSFGSLFAGIGQGGRIVYDETKIQEYANERYQEAFGQSSAYEDNLLIVFLTNEASDGYYCIAWIGDNVNGQINELLGDEYTAFGRAMRDNIADYHAYSLSSNLAGVMEDMTEAVERLGLSSSFRKASDHSNMAESALVNRSLLSVSSATVEDALEDFTQATDIPTVIVIDQVENVFDTNLGQSVFTLIILGIFAAVAIALIVKAARSSKGKGGTPNSGGQASNESNRTSSNPEW